MLNIPLHTVCGAFIEEHFIPIIQLSKDYENLNAFSLFILLHIFLT